VRLGSLSAGSLVRAEGLFARVKASPVGTTPASTFTGGAEIEREFDAQRRWVRSSQVGMHLDTTSPRTLEGDFFSPSGTPFKSGGLAYWGINNNYGRING
jgi:hypothetical protein